jgi:predicted nucleic acid-binding protein
LSIVIDTSVAVKWLFPDEQSDVADELLSGEEELLAPELIYFEVGNVVWKRVVAGKVDYEHGADLLREFARIPLVTADIRSLSAIALQIAAIHRRTFYDSAYLALAAVRGCKLVTADEWLVNSLSGTELAKTVRLL